MNKKFNFVLFTLTISISVCAKDKFSFPQQEEILHDISKTQDVSGFLPERVLIRTMTQSYCKYFDFVIVDGRIYAKKAGEKKWELFLKTGLPFKAVGGDKFDTPRAIREIACDADSLYAFDDQGIMYTIFFKKRVTEKSFTWRRLSGFPRKNYVQQNDLVLKKRGWSMGARRDDILWYEDRYGNQHHYGTMGLETFYFLTEDGQHIRFSDSGLPPDFSRSIECPENGSFIAENISVSGDTIFLIGNQGTMYTRLIDFDTMGCDPMFFQYTYDVQNQNEKGTDYISNYTAWALPAEDWAKQSPIPLFGKARLTKMISIAQTGQGNYARELRVAGCDKDGTVGYYHKMLFEDKWSFNPANLVLDESVWLDPTKSEFGREQIFSYEGYMTKNGAKIEGVKCFVSGLALSSEDRCSFRISYGDEEFSCRLFPVEKWTYVLRHDPAFDGTPRYYFITPEFNESKLDAYSPAFKEILYDIFKGKNHFLFAYSALATTEYYEIDIDGRDSNIFLAGRMHNSYKFFMTKDGRNIHPFVFRGSTALFQSGSSLENPLDEKFLLEEGKVYSIKDRSEIERKIVINMELKEKLEKEIKASITSQETAELSRWGYNLLDLVTRVTFLNKLNFPKIKQMTSYGGDIMSSNASLYRDLLAYSEWTYPSMLELLELRIKYYGKLIKAFDNNEVEATLHDGFHNSFSKYYADIGLPSHLEGNNETMDEFSLNGLFPWFLIQKADGTTILMRLKDSAKLILDFNSKYRIPAAFTVVSVQSSEKHPLPDKDKSMSDIDSYEGEFVWDGHEATISLRNSVFGKKIIFKGTVKK